MLIMDDTAKNLKFVELVETYQCLYDIKNDSYTRMDIKEKAWMEISKAMNESVQTCKERWKNIRTVFLRHFRKIPPSGSAGGIKKKYYLEDALQFLLPFVKSNRNQTSNLTVECDDTESTVPETEEETESSEVNTQSQLNQNELPETPTTPRVNHTRDNRVTALKRKNKDIDAEKSLAEYFDAKRANFSNKNESADQKFLLSLLPDLELMNASQKRRCKREFLEIIDKILQDNSEGHFRPISVNSTKSDYTNNFTCPPGPSSSSSCQSRPSSAFTYHSDTLNNYQSTSETQSSRFTTMSAPEPSEPSTSFQCQSDNYVYNYEH